MRGKKRCCDKDLVLLRNFHTMEKRRRICCDEDLPPLLLGEDDLIQNILMWLPVVSLLRFKSVSKSWCALIESPFFIDLHTKATTLKSFSSKFGSFVFHVTDVKVSPTPLINESIVESAVIMLSSSDSTSESGSGSGSGSSSDSTSQSGSRSSGGWCWSTGTDHLCGQWASWRPTFRPTWKGLNGVGEDGDDESVDYYDDDDEVFTLDNNLGGGGRSDDDDDDDQLVVFKLDNLGTPSCYKFFPVPKIIGSCNGLICLLDRSNVYDKQPHMDFSLWNPATRQFRSLPKSITIERVDVHYYYSYAFGFDVETKDYKVVLVTGFKPKSCWVTEQLECLCQVQVYSLSTDSWRLLEGITCLPGFPFYDTFEGLYLNGSCFFMSKFLQSQQHHWSDEKNNRFIISFDLTKEIMNTIQLPDHERNQKLYLSCLGDQMALFTVSYQSNPSLWDGNDTGIYDYSDFDIWVLKNEHGCSAVNKEESWTKLHSFRIGSRVPGDLNIPRGISNDGEFALVESKGGINGLSKKMMLYSLVTKEVKKNFLSCNGVQSRAAYAYKPSIVPIVGGKGTTAAHS